MGGDSLHGFGCKNIAQMSRMTLEAKAILKIYPAKKIKWTSTKT